MVPLEYRHTVWVQRPHWLWGYIDKPQARMVTDDLRAFLANVDSLAWWHPSECHFRIRGGWRWYRITRAQLNRMNPSNYQTWLQRMRHLELQDIDCY